MAGQGPTLKGKVLRKTGRKTSCIENIQKKMEDLSIWTFSELPDDMSNPDFYTSSPIASENNILPASDGSSMSLTSLNDSVASPDRLSTISEETVASSPSCTSFSSLGESMYEYDQDKDMMYALKRLLGKYHRANPSFGELPDSAKYLSYLIEKLLEEYQKTVLDLKRQLQQKNDEIHENNRLAHERQEAIVQEHKKRVSAIVKDHESHLIAAIERSMNARRQSAGLQSQLSRAMSDLKLAEKRHQGECAAIRSKYDEQLESLKEELEKTKREGEGVSLGKEAGEVVSTNDGSNSSLSKQDSAEQPRLDLEVSDLRQDVARQEEDIASLKDILGGKREELQSLQRTLEQVNADLATKVQEVHNSSAKVVALSSTLGSLDKQIETLTKQASKRDESLVVFQQKVHEREQHLKSLAKKIKAEKRRSSDMGVSVQIAKEQEHATLDRLRSLEREKDSLESQCTIRRSQLDTLSDILFSREKTILMLKKKLQHTDSELYKMFEQVASSYIPPLSSEGPNFDVSWTDFASGEGPQDADHKILDMSLESSLVSTPILCNKESGGVDAVASVPRIEWLRKNGSLNSLDADSGVSSTLESKVFSQEVGDFTLH